MVWPLVVRVKWLGNPLEIYCFKVLKKAATLVVAAFLP